MSDIHLWILLHGLISVSWTLLWRDLGDLSMVHEGKVTLWKDSLRRAFGAFCDHTQAMFSSRMAESGAPLDAHMYWTGIPFAHLGECRMASLRCLPRHSVDWFLDSDEKMLRLI